MRWVLLLAATACAAPTPPKPTPAPESKPAPTAAPIAVGSAPTLAPRETGSPFAPSPLSALASGMRDIVWAALDGRPLPENGIAVEPARDPERRVRSKHPVPPTRELDVLAFAMEVTVILRPSSPDDGESTDDGSIEAIAFLSRTGLKVAGLETKGSRRPLALPPWLSGVERFGQDLVAALRGRRMGELLVGEAERSVLNDELLYRRLMDERPKLERLEQAERVAAKHAAIAGYKLDDAFLVARDRRGGIWGFQLEIEDSDGRVALDGSPLVRVEKLEKDAEERSSAPPPPPPATP